MTDNKFCGNETFEEWTSKQNKDNLEFQIIKETHKIYPGWSLDEIKIYTPGFLSNHLKLIQDISREYPELSIGDLEKFISDYVEICKTNNNIYIETFGMSPVNINHLSKWNSTIGRITKILFEHPGRGHVDTPKYKPKDEKGHSNSYKTKIGGKQYSIRADEQLGRDISTIRSDHKHRFETESDFLREVIFKGVYIYTLINKDSLKEGGDILLSMESKISEENELSRKQRKDDIDIEIVRRIEHLEEISDYKDEKDRKELLKIFRDNLHKYLNENLTYFVGSTELKIAIKCAIKENRDLEDMLKKLVENKLISREYMDSILKEAKVIPYIGFSSGEDAIPREKDKDL